MRPSVCITIDTEGDSADNPHSTFFGIQREIPVLLDIFERRRIKATFFVQQDATCAVGSRFRDIWKTAEDRGHEIGLHIHGLTGRSDEQKSELIRRSAENMRGLGFDPVSFRAGTFSLSGSMLPMLEAIGIRFDSSVVPGLRETDKAGRERCNHIGAPHLPYHPSPGDHTQNGESSILELPVNRYEKIRSHAFRGILTGYGKEEALFDHFRENRKDPVIIMVLHSWDRLQKLFQNMVRRRFGTYGRGRRWLYHVAAALNKKRILDRRSVSYLEEILEYFTDQGVDFRTIRETGEWISRAGNV